MVALAFIRHAKSKNARVVATWLVEKYVFCVTFPDKKKAAIRLPFQKSYLFPNKHGQNSLIGKYFFSV